VTLVVAASGQRLEAQPEKDAHAGKPLPVPVESNHGGGARLLEPRDRPQTGMAHRVGITRRAGATGRARVRAGMGAVDGENANVRRSGHPDGRWGRCPDPLQGREYYPSLTVAGALTALVAFAAGRQEEITIQLLDLHIQTAGARACGLLDVHPGAWQPTADHPSATVRPSWQGMRSGARDEK
jgi:hypothetical protein